VSRTRRRFLVVAVGALCLAPLLSACGAGQNAAVIRPMAPGDGIVTTVGSSRIINALVVVDPADPSRGVVSMTVANPDNVADEVVAITSSQGTVTQTGPNQVPADGALTFGAAGGASALINGLTAPAGSDVTLTVRLLNAGEVTFTAVLYPATGPFATLTPPPTAG
jgi:hypothetical protein